MNLEIMPHYCTSIYWIGMFGSNYFMCFNQWVVLEIWRRKTTA